MCAVRLRHKDKRFFLVPGDGPALQGMADIQLLDILKTVCKVMGNCMKAGKFDSQTVQASNGPSIKANKAQQIKADNVDLNDANSNMPDYFRYSSNRAADKRARQILMNIMHSEFSDSFSEIVHFEGMFSLHVKDDS